LENFNVMISNGFTVNETLPFLRATNRVSRSSKSTSETLVNGRLVVNVHLPRVP